MRPEFILYKLASRKRVLFWAGDRWDEKATLAIHYQSLTLAQHLAKGLSRNPKNPVQVLSSIKEGNLVVAKTVKSDRSKSDVHPPVLRTVSALNVSGGRQRTIAAESKHVE